MKRSTAGRAKSERLDTNALVSCHLSYWLESSLAADVANSARETPCWGPAGPSAARGSKGIAILDYSHTILTLRRELEALKRTIERLEKIQGNAIPKSRRGRKSMDAEERLAVSARLKKYWADRRRARSA